MHSENGVGSGGCKVPLLVMVLWVVCGVLDRGCRQQGSVGRRRLQLARVVLGRALGASGLDRRSAYGVRLLQTRAWEVRLGVKTRVGQLTPERIRGGRRGGIGRLLLWRRWIALPSIGYSQPGVDTKYIPCVQVDPWTESFPSALALQVAVDCNCSFPFRYHTKARAGVPGYS